MTSQKDVETSVEKLIRCVDSEHPNMIVHVRGSIGSYFIGIRPQLGPIQTATLPWFTAHEVCHLLAGDWIEIPGFQTIASLAIAVLTTRVLKWSLLPSIGMTAVAHGATFSVMSHRAENRADAFANQHCTKEEKEKAITFFEELSKRRPTGLSGTLYHIQSLVSYPFDSTRIANIKATLEAAP